MTSLTPVLHNVVMTKWQKKGKRENGTLKNLLTFLPPSAAIVLTSALLKHPVRQAFLARIYFQQPIWTAPIQKEAPPRLILCRSDLFLQKAERVLLINEFGGIDGTCEVYFSVGQFPHARFCSTQVETVLVNCKRHKNITCRLLPCQRQP